MDLMHAELLWKGAVLGFSIAAPVGPIGALAIGRTLRDGRAAGLATGLGAASADSVYGAAATFGLAALAGPAAAAPPWLRWAGGAFLICYGIRLVAARGRARGAAPAGTSGGAFLSAFLLTLANPMTILAFAAMLGSFGAVGAGGAGLTLVAGVFLGSMAWWTFLSWVVAAAAGKLGGRRFPALDCICGCVLAAFGLHALLRH
jgi:threonine/homoserine/homoserine lactone efflux protein